MKLIKKETSSRTLTKSGFWNQIFKRYFVGGCRFQIFDVFHSSLKEIRQTKILFAMIIP